MSDEIRHRNVGLWLAGGIVGAFLAAIELAALIFWIVVGSPATWQTLLILVGFVLLTLASISLLRRWAPRSGFARQRRSLI